ncbi:hypothetical protein ACFX1Z_041833 [Malus domestica]
MAIWRMRDIRFAPPTYDTSLNDSSASKPPWSILPATSPSSPSTSSSATPPTLPPGLTPSSPSSTISPSCPSHLGLSQKRLQRVESLLYRESSDDDLVEFKLVIRRSTNHDRVHDSVHLTDEQSTKRKKQKHGSFWTWLATDLYFWNPETKVTQYDRPTSSVAPSKPSSAQSISSSVHVHQSSQGQRRPDEGDNRYGRGSNGGSKFDTRSRNQQVSKLATWVTSYTVAAPCNLLGKHFLLGTDTWGRVSLLNLPCPLPQEVIPVTKRERHFHPQLVFPPTLSASVASEAHQGRTSSSKSSADADGDTKKSKR